MTDFAKEVQERRESALTSDKDNRTEALLDLKFEGMDQWDPEDRRMRESTEHQAFPLPCLTIDMTGTLVGQVTGDRMANQTSIKALPAEDGDKDIAEIRSELIRSIEFKSKAQRAYDRAFHNQVSCGIGNFRIDIDYAHDETFDRDLFIRAIPNPLAVLWDPMSADPTGRDADFCFVEERIRKDDYEARFKSAPTNSLNDTTEGGSDWFDGDTVRICEYLKMTTKPRTIAMFQDGSVKDITGMNPMQLDPMSFPAPVMVNPKTGQPYVRDVDCKYATRILTNGKEELEEAVELKLFRLPVIRCMGHEVWVGDKRIRFGLIRKARDPQRLKNYMRSVAAEKLMFAPRHSYMAGAAAIKGRERDWPNTLVYNDNSPNAPQEATQNNLQALIQMSEMFAQDMKDVTGIHDASLGVRSNETSGVAIARRQQEGDIATIIFPQNFNYSLEEGGEVVNALIPQTFDTMRTIRLLGEDESVKLLRVNDPNDPESVDLAKGQYDIRIATGPAYSTRRQEASGSMMEANRDSQGKLMDIAGDLIVDAMDWPNADKIKQRIRKSLPANLIEDDEEPTPEQVQAKQQAEQEAQEMKDLARREAQAKVVEAEAKARKAVKEADDAEQGINRQTVDAKNAETSRLKAITAKDFPLPPSAVAILTPIVTQAIIEALQSPDALPLPIHAEIAEEAFDAANGPSPEEIAETMAAQQPPQEGAM